MLFTLETTKRTKKPAITVSPEVKSVYFNAAFGEVINNFSISNMDDSKIVFILNRDLLRVTIVRGDNAKVKADEDDFILTKDLWYNIPYNNGKQKTSFKSIFIPPYHRQYTEFRKLISKYIKRKGFTTSVRLVIDKVIVCGSNLTELQFKLEKHN